MSLCRLDLFSSILRPNIPDIRGRNVESVSMDSKIILWERLLNLKRCQFVEQHENNDGKTEKCVKHTAILNMFLTFLGLNLKMC